MTQKNQIIALTVEADRYRNLAKDIDLDLLQNPTAADAEKKKHTAQMHLIRAKTFRTSIKLITGQLEPVAN